jgi:antitoxin component YwqK of YwqJK toxin-antitoxin module
MKFYFKNDSIMKKLLVLLFSLLISFNSYSKNVCSDKLMSGMFDLIDSTVYLQIRDGLYYLPNQSKPYSGEDLCIFKDASAKYFLKATIQDGLSHGKFTYWYPNGQIWMAGNYVHGEEEGIFISWHQNGQISSVSVPLATGVVKETEWDSLGQKRSEVSYKDGKRDGELTMWIPIETIWKDDQCIGGECSNDYY